MTENKTAVVARGLGKRYALAGSRPVYGSFRESAMKALGAPVRGLARILDVNGQKAGPANTFWALRDVSFDVRPGEVVGLIGRNGSGKTTLLKILSRITEPTEGRAELHGRVGSLLEVGTGFHAELSGRENVYLNGAILGMTRREMDEKFDQIVAFSEVERFLDMPVKHYSAGMSVRLAFAVAAHLDPEILLVDEVLAVGDHDFQKKCLGKMHETSEQGKTAFLVSHDMTAILGLCDRAILLDGGRIRAQGPVDDVVSEYLSGHRDDARQAIHLSQRTDREGNGNVRFTSFHLERDGKTVSHARSGDVVDLVLGYRAKESFTNIFVQVAILDRLGKRLLSFSNRVTGDELGPVPLDGHFVCRIPRVPLLPDDYELELVADVNRAYADIIHAGAFAVVEGDFFGTGKSFQRREHGAFQADHAWSIRGSQVGNSRTISPVSGPPT